MNSNTLIKLINKYPEKKWDWDLISCNSNINMKDIEENIDKPWNWEYISLNSNLTLDFIEKYNDKKWDWHNISSNEFLKDEWFLNEIHLKYNKIIQTKYILKDLIEKSCHPSRFIEWCLDEDDKYLMYK